MKQIEKKIKIVLSAFLLFSALISTVFAQTILPAEKDSNIILDMRTFLKALNNGGGKPVEELAPKDARMVLVNAQKSVAFTYNDIEEKQQKITQDGITVNIHIVKPKGAKANIPVFMFFHGENQEWFPSNVGWKSQLIADNGFCRVQNMTACGQEV